jgi:hypothetical protein
VPAEPVRDHHGLGAAAATGGEQFERAATVGLGAAEEIPQRSNLSGCVMVSVGTRVATQRVVP